MLPVKIGLSFHGGKPPPGTRRGVSVSCACHLTAVSIAIIKAVGLPVALSGPVVARV